MKLAGGGDEWEEGVPGALMGNAGNTPAAGSLGEAEKISGDLSEISEDLTHYLFSEGNRNKVF